MTHLHITITKNTIFAPIKMGRTCKMHCEFMRSAYFYQFSEERWCCGAVGVVESDNLWLFTFLIDNEVAIAIRLREVS